MGGGLLCCPSYSVARLRAAAGSGKGVGRPEAHPRRQARCRTQPPLNIYIYVSPHSSRMICPDRPLMMITRITCHVWMHLCVHCACACACACACVRACVRITIKVVRRSQVPFALPRGEAEPGGGGPGGGGDQQQPHRLLLLQVHRHEVPTRGTYLATTRPPFSLPSLSFSGRYPLHMHSFSPICSMLYALCSMPYALCPMPYALCPMPYALCPMPYAISVMCYLCYVLSLLHRMGPLLIHPTWVLYTTDVGSQHPTQALPPHPLVVLQERRRRR